LSGVCDRNVCVHISDIKGSKSGIFIERYIIQIVDEMCSIFDAESVGEGDELIEFCIEKFR
jgi:hypothetical protein